MKTLIFTLAASLCTTFSFAQMPDAALARVRYSFIHQRDTTQRNNPYTENMLLVVGKNASLYTSYDKINREIASTKSAEATTKIQAGVATPFISKPGGTPFKPVTLVDLYFFVKEQQLITKDQVLTTYLVTEAIPKIDWKLTKDSATIAGIPCHRAFAKFKGRNWNAWYAANLPFQFGPWKLTGLPGLIVEAYDDKKEVQFKFAGIDKIEKENIDKSNFYLGAEIKLQDGAERTTRSAFDKLKTAFDQDPIGFHAAASGLPRNRVFAGRSTTGVVHNVINNPLELTEK